MLIFFLWSGSKKKRKRKSTSEEEKSSWKYRAEELKYQHMDQSISVAEIDDEDLTEPYIASDDNGGGKKRAIFRKTTLKTTSV